MKVRKIIIKNPLSDKPFKGCLICLPGLGVPAKIMLKFSKYMQLKRTLMVSLEPYRLAWYPRPNGMNDQEKTVMGLPYATAAAQDAVDVVKKAYGFNNSQIALLGFSAGAVVALQVAMKAKEPFAACVSLAGAIFEPDKVKKPINNTPIILQHNKGDFCFDWYERYLPMKDALKKNGYDVTVLERPNGSHTLYIDDAVSVSKLIATSLGYPKWYAENIKVK